MARVRFSLEYFFDENARVVWDKLVDWKGHENWVPSTEISIHTEGNPTAPGAEFTAWTGVLLGTSIGRKLSLEDRMEVDFASFDGDTEVGEARLTKVGPLLTGGAGFTVEQMRGGTSTKTRVYWHEDINVPYAPQFMAPLFAAIGKNGFAFAMRQLDKVL